MKNIKNLIIIYNPNKRTTPDNKIKSIQRLE